MLDYKFEYRSISDGYLLSDVKLVTSFCIYRKNQRKVQQKGMFSSWHSLCEITSRDKFKYKSCGTLQFVELQFGTLLFFQQSFVFKPKSDKRFTRQSPKYRQSIQEKNGRHFENDREKFGFDNDSGLRSTAFLFMQIVEENQTSVRGS